MSGFLQKVFGGNNPTDSADGTQQTQQTQADTESNPESNIDQASNIWDNSQNPPENPSPGQDFQQQQQNVQQQQQGSTPQEQFAAHIDGLGLTNNVDMAKIQEDMQTGNTDSLSKAFQQVAANTYKATMLQMNELVDSKINKAQSETEKAASDNWNADLAVREMNTKLPFTSDPNISPIATAVLNRFITKGDSVESAIKKTQDFFASTAQKINGTSMPPANSPGNSQFSQQNSDNNSNNQTQANSHDEWLDVLAQ